MNRAHRRHVKREQERRRRMMREVTLTADQFDNFLFPVWSNAQDPGDPEVVIRVTKKLKAVSDEEPLTPAQVQAIQQGAKIYADRKAVGETVTLLFEEDEHRVIRDAYKQSLSKFNTMAMEDAFEVNQILQNAEPPVQDEEAPEGE